MSAYRLLSKKKNDKKKTLQVTNKHGREQRLYCDWPVWFSQESEKRFADANCFEGKMINISSMGMIFRCEAEENSLYIDQQITIRFRVPRFGSFEPFNMLLTTHTGHICRVCNMNNLWHQIAIKFDNPLFFRPGEQGLTEYEVLQKLKGIVIQDGVPYTVGA